MDELVDSKPKGKRPKEPWQREKKGGKSGPLRNTQLVLDDEDEDELAGERMRAALQPAVVVMGSRCKLVPCLAGDRHACVHFKFLNLAAKQLANRSCLHCSAAEVVLKTDSWLPADEAPVASIDAEADLLEEPTSSGPGWVSAEQPEPVGKIPGRVSG